MYLYVQDLEHNRSREDKEFQPKGKISKVSAGKVSNYKAEDGGGIGNQQERSALETDQQVMTYGCLEDIPPAARLLRSMRAIRFALRITAIQLANALNLLQRQLEQLLLANDVEVATDAGVFAGKTLDFSVGEMSAQTHVQLAGKVVVEFGEELDVEEEDCC